MCVNDHEDFVTDKVLSIFNSIWTSWLDDFDISIKE